MARLIKQSKWEHAVQQKMVSKTFVENPFAAVLFTN